MAIISVPSDIRLDEVVCIICGECISLSLATAGLCNSDNQQAFACNNHFRSGQQFIVGWVDFIITQRLVHLEEGCCSSIGAESAEEGRGHEWAVC